MRGQVVHIASDESDGFIRGEDGNRYSFAVTDLLSSEPALVGASVDFEMADGRATMVCAIPANAAAPLASFVASLKKHKGILIGLVIVVLLLIAANSAMVRGTFSAATGDEHGPVKTYQVTGLAKVRNMPTTQGSTVLNQLNPGDSFSGQIYLGPDGKSPWVKREGAEEYVSVVNLSEVTTNSLPVASASPAQYTQNETGFNGFWRNDRHRSLLTISTAGDSFVIDARTDELGNMLNGSFSGTPRGNTLETGTMLGNMSITDNGQTLVFAGYRFYRTSKEGEATRATNEQQAAQAQLQAAQAAQAAQNNAAIENGLNTNARAYVYNCETNRGGSSEYYYCGELERFKSQHADKVAIAEAALQRCLKVNPGNPNAACYNYQVDWSR